jgi:hypothetical protein
MQTQFWIVLLAFVLGSVCEITTRDTEHCKDYYVCTPWAFKGYYGKNCRGGSVKQDNGSWSSGCRNLGKPAVSYNVVARDNCNVDVFTEKGCRGRKYSTSSIEGKNKLPGFLGELPTPWAKTRWLVGGSVDRIKPKDKRMAVLSYRARCE